MTNGVVTSVWYGVGPDSFPLNCIHPLSSLHEQDGGTALLLASQGGHVEVVELLLQEHADASICHEV